MMKGERSEGVLKREIKESVEERSERVLNRLLVMPKEKRLNSYAKERDQREFHPLGLQC